MVRALVAGRMETMVFWPCVSTRAAYSGPDPASGVMTTANADPRLAPRGALTGATSVCPARTDTTWLPVMPVPAVPPELA